MQTYDFFGTESKFIQLLREFNICNDVYYSTLQCFGCCSDFTITVQLGSITYVASTLQTCVNDKLLPKKCKKCLATDTNIELLRGHFQATPPLLVVELGHLPELKCQLVPNDLDESIYITNHSKTLCYKLAGYTLLNASHFFLLINIDNVWYKYNDIMAPKLVEWGKHCS